MILWEASDRDIDTQTLTRNWCFLSEIGHSLSPHEFDGPECLSIQKKRLVARVKSGALKTKSSIR